MRRAVSITLGIPDNEAYTALVALRRLGVEVGRVERSDVYLFEDRGDAEALERRIVGDETIFNPNKHRLTLLEAPAPRAGEVWIESSSSRSARDDAGRIATAWRLFDERGEPVSRGVIEAASERLLCNPAIDRAVIGGSDADRDIPSGAE